jgi:hypothetical protein
VCPCLPLKSLLSLHALFAVTITTFISMIAMIHDLTMTVTAIWQTAPIKKAIETIAFFNLR